MFHCLVKFSGVFVGVRVQKQLLIKKLLLSSFLSLEPKRSFLFFVKKNCWVLNVSYENDYSPINNNRHPHITLIWFNLLPKEARKKTGEDIIIQDYKNCSRRLMTVSLAEATTLKHK